MQMDIYGILEDQNPWWHRGAATGGKSLMPRAVQPMFLRFLLEDTERRALVLRGPRQVGKTTLLLLLAQDLLAHGIPRRNIVYFDFDDDRLGRGPLDPGAILAATLDSLDRRRPAFYLLDEICKARNWARWLKRMVDTEERRGTEVAARRFMATDSAAGRIAYGGRESGLGRFQEESMEGMDFAEFVALSRFRGTQETGQVTSLQPQSGDLERYLERGGFPEHIFAGDPRVVRKRIREDVADKAILKDIGTVRASKVDLQRVLELFVYLAQNSGAVFNAAGWAKDLGVDRRSVSAWLRLLEDAMLVRRLPGFSKSAASMLKTRPKIYVGDHCLIPAFAAMLAPLRDSAVMSGVFEAVVFRHLRGLTKAKELRLGFFNRGSRGEVDFVLLEEGASRPVCIEVTQSPAPSRKKVYATLAAARELNARHTVIICGAAPRDASVAGVEIVSLLDFLVSPPRVLGQGRQR